MGSKNRLLPWIHSVLGTLDFETAADPFSGSGCVAYLLKAMGRRVVALDFLNFSAPIAEATIGNSHHQLDGPALKRILGPVRNGPDFIEKTFGGFFFEYWPPESCPLTLNPRPPKFCVAQHDRPFGLNRRLWNFLASCTQAHYSGLTYERAVTK
jgi:hypothetical protein